MTGEELKGYVNDNPDLWFYQLVYGLGFIVMMFVGLMKGIGIARQLLLGMIIATTEGCNFSQLMADISVLLLEFFMDKEDCEQDLGRSVRRSAVKSLMKLKCIGPHCKVVYAVLLIKTSQVE